MKLNSGFITLHRSILEWEWYDDLKVFRLFVHCLLSANHRDKKYRGFLIKRGEFVTSRDKLSIETGMSTREVRTALEKLKTTSELNVKTSGKGTVIQVVKYNEYQKKSNERPANDQLSTNERPTSDQRATTNNNDNNDNNENNINIPTLQEFYAYAISLNDKVSQIDVKAKYHAWVENDWKDGNDKKIIRWKSKLAHSIKYMKLNK